MVPFVFWSPRECLHYSSGPPVSSEIFFFVGAENCNFNINKRTKSWGKTKEKNVKIGMNCETAISSFKIDPN